MHTQDDAVATDDVFWNRIIGPLSEGLVIPIIGQDLLTVQSNGSEQKLYSLLAHEVAQRLALDTHDLVCDDALNRVAYRELAKRGDLGALYPTLKVLLPLMEALPIPEPLLKLAEITDFTTYVTTTFDPMMRRALEEVRGKAPRQIAYSPDRIGDLPEKPTPGETILFYLFGSLSSVPEYAVTEEDVLEFIHSLGSESRRPPALFHELSRKHLLIIGSCFPDWLARFFLRAARRERLLRSGGGRKSDFLVDQHAAQDSNVLFLRNFQTGTQVFCGGDACSFVDELHRRWMTRTPARSLRTTAFLSYASEDVDIAARVRDLLDRHNVPVFFDRESIKGGEVWKAEVQRAIGDAFVFIPIISKHNLQFGNRSFRIEWKQACSVAAETPPSQNFIVPLYVDDTPPRHRDIAPYFGALSAVQIAKERLMADAADAEIQKFTAQIRSQYNAYRRETMS